jgi:hypothetical protein
VEGEPAHVVLIRPATGAAQAQAALSRRREGACGRDRDGALQGWRPGANRGADQADAGADEPEGSTDSDEVELSVCAARRCRRGDGPSALENAALISAKILSARSRPIRTTSVRN